MSTFCFIFIKNFNINFFIKACLNPYSTAVPTNPLPMIPIAFSYLIFSKIPQNQDDYIVLIL